MHVVFQRTTLPTSRTANHNDGRDRSFATAVPGHRKFCRMDIGKRSPAVPVTSPYVRVRIRRFGGLGYRYPVNGGIPSEAK
jgi:hypothetical protein